MIKCRSFKVQRTYLNGGKLLTSFYTTLYFFLIFMYTERCFSTQSKLFKSIFPFLISFFLSFFLDAKFFYSPIITFDENNLFIFTLSRYNLTCSTAAVLNLSIRFNI